MNQARIFHDPRQRFTAQRLTVYTVRLLLKFQPCFHTVHFVCFA